MKNRLVSTPLSKALAVHAGAVSAGPTITVAGAIARLLEPEAARIRTIPATVDRAPAQAGSGLTDAVALRSVLPEMTVAQHRTILTTVDRVAAQAGSVLTDAVVRHGALADRFATAVSGATFRAIRRIPAEGAGAGAETTAYRG